MVRLLVFLASLTLSTIVQAAAVFGGNATACSPSYPGFCDYDDYLFPLSYNMGIAGFRAAVHVNTPFPNAVVGDAIADGTLDAETRRFHLFTSVSYHEPEGSYGSPDIRDTAASVYMRATDTLTFYNIPLVPFRVYFNRPVVEGSLYGDCSGTNCQFDSRMGYTVDFSDTKEALYYGQLQYGSVYNNTQKNSGDTGQSFITVPTAAGPVLMKIYAYASSSVGEFGTAYADYSNTISWGGIAKITRLDGTLIDGWSVSSESGIAWDQPAAAVPEIEKSLMMLAGLLVVALRAKRKHRQTPHSAFVGHIRGDRRSRAARNVGGRQATRPAALQSPAATMASGFTQTGRIQMTFVSEKPGPWR